MNKCQFYSHVHIFEIYSDWQMRENNHLYQIKIAVLIKLFYLINIFLKVGEEIV